MSKLTIETCDAITVRELLERMQEGFPVFRTSHAGNWNLYKLLFSELGIPDCIWDVTCIYHDVNNQPRYQLVGGQRIPLLNGTDPGAPGEGIKFLTPYYRVHGDPDGPTLSHFHVQPLIDRFGERVITTQSRFLLEYKERIRDIFEAVQWREPERLGRYVLPCGCMVNLACAKRGMYAATCSHHSVTIEESELANSALATLEELERLVFHPTGYVPKGGVLYSFDLVVATFLLACFWKFGKTTVYMLSGPDMMSYATKEVFVDRVEQTLRLIRRTLPYLVPEKMEMKIVPGTSFRFGYPKHRPDARRILLAHELLWELQSVKRTFKGDSDMRKMVGDFIEKPLTIVTEGKSAWDLFHDPATDIFYSQHDVQADGAEMVVRESYLDRPFSEMVTMLSELSHWEKKLSKRLPVLRSE